VQIVDVVKGSPSYRAGLKEGDIIISLDNKPVASVDDIQRRLNRESIGKSMKIVLLRGWTIKLEKTVVPAESPE
jgi:S1-C subfamily serine protease